MSDPIIAGVVSGIILTLLLGIWKVVHDAKDTNKIILFLEDSKATTDNKFRSSHAISSETNIPEDRVGKLCSLSGKIKRNANEQESWRLA